MKRKKFFLNISTSLLSQIVSTITSLIVPVVIITYFGSEINGLIISITYFLSFIVIAEGGVGAVIRSSLYQPLANRDIEKISGIIKTSNLFFTYVGLFLVFYTFLLMIFYPVIVDHSQSTTMIILLISIISLGNFSQYFFGISYQILLQADQRQYINILFQIITNVLSAGTVVLLTMINLDVQYVILGSSIISFLRPLLLRMYVKKNYDFKRDYADYNENLLMRKWDGLGHHFAYISQTTAPIAILTFLLPISIVSVYSIYFLVINGVKKITTTFFVGLESLLGNLIATNDKEKLSKAFKVFELVSFIIICIMFTTTTVSITNFISIYTKDFSDANYNFVFFSMIFITAEVIFCLKIPYQSLIFAAGHFRQTKMGAYVEAILTVVVTFLGIYFWGLIGSVLGVLVSGMVRFFQYLDYLSKESNIIIITKKSVVLKVIFYFGLAIFINVTIGFFDFFNELNYVSWLIDVLKSFVLTSLVVISASYIVYNKIMKSVYRVLKTFIANTLTKFRLKMGKDF